MKKLFALALTLGLFCFSQWPAFAQEQPTPQASPQPSAEDQDKQKAEREANAYRLLDQVLDEAQSLRLAENRIRVQINAADMLWDQNQQRARSLFAMASEGVAELGRSQGGPTLSRRMGDGQVSFLVNNQVGIGPGGPMPNLRSVQLRQELVLAAARHDAALAYQLLAATKPPVTTPPANPDGRTPQMMTDEALEQNLLGRIAALDPKMAAQNADQMLDKGQFPVTLPDVINQLQRQDADAADKLADKAVKKLLASNIASNTQAMGLVQSLLRNGPRPAVDASASTANAAAKEQPRGTPAVLPQSSYIDLLSAAVDAALKAVPVLQTGQQATAGPRGRPGVVTARPNNASQPATDAQIQQNNARRMLAVLANLMPMVDQYLPGRASSVRQKMTEMGMPLTAFTAINNQGEATTDALIQAAATAPQQMQARLYQQAAYKALDDGDIDRARQIATDHLQSNARDAVMKRVDFREMTKKAEGARFDEVKQAMARLTTDNEKLDLLLQVASDAQTTNPKLALQCLDEARQMTNRRATNYDNFEQQLKVAHALASVDGARTFEVLDPGINHLNELLSAASVLSGFEINMFRDGEMTMQGGNGLTGMVNRYGQELAVLARNDLERSETLAGRFQFPEARIMARMAIVQGLLGFRPAVGGGRGGFGGGPVTIRQD